MIIHLAKIVESKINKVNQIKFVSAIRQLKNNYYSLKIFYHDLWLDGSSTAGQ